MSAEPQIRSYQRAFGQDLLLYGAGDIQFWRAVPARGAIWLAVLEVLALICGHLVGFHARLLSMPWAIYYLGAPAIGAWLFASAKIEGRRLHVVLVALVSQYSRGQVWAGAYRPLAALPKQTWRPGSIRVVQRRA